MIQTAAIALSSLAPNQRTSIADHMRMLIASAFLILCTSCNPSKGTTESRFVEINYRGNRAVAELRGGKLYIQGDILVVPGDLDELEPTQAPSHRNGTQRRAISRKNGKSYKWGGTSNGFNKVVINYSSEKLGLAATSAATVGIKWWTTAVPQLQFTQLRSCAEDCIEFIPETDPNLAGHSVVGRQGGTQEIGLGDKVSGGVAAHEIGHALGLFHEQQRDDHTQFIAIHYENILDGYDGNFVLDGGFKLFLYDYDSLMHYDAMALSKNDKETITPIQTLPKGVYLGQRNHLSVNDIAGMKAMYPSFWMNDVAFSLGSYPLAALRGREFIGPGPSSDFNVNFNCVVSRGTENLEVDNSNLDASRLSGPGTYQLQCKIRSNFWQLGEDNEETWTESKELTVLSAGLIPVLFF